MLGSSGLTFHFYVGQWVSTVLSHITHVTSPLPGVEFVSVTAMCLAVCGTFSKFLGGELF